MKSPYFYFHANLMGFDCYKKGKFVPKYILYWSGYNSEKILTRKTNIELKPRK